ncbi:MAG: hypothetical protein PHZ26_02715 [Candidatus Gracilibacteria bacterium]|nr:hypothetical protein [Candidatus Gracilibacteria bacterium]MDD2908645.1 hypothetical protein [Candidatus Gracilibacteria bacterium]
MSGPKFDEIDWEKYEESLEGFDFETIKGDTIKVTEIVEELVAIFKLPIINNKINAILNNPNGYSDTYLKEKLNIINTYAKQLIIKAKCLEKMFALPPREGDDQESLTDNCPHIAIYESGKLSWVNKAYADSLGLTSLGEAKELAAKWYEENGVRKNALIERVYHGFYKEKVYKMLPLLNNNEGYQNVHFEIGADENNQKNLNWSSFGINNGAGSVRISGDITEETKDMTEEEIKSHLDKYYGSKGLDGIPFGFKDSLALFKKEMGLIYGDKLFDAKFYEIFKKMNMFTEMADVMFNKGPFAMNLYNGNKLELANEQYIALTGMTLDEIKDASEKGTLGKILFGGGVEAEFVKQSVGTLDKEGGHYHRIFSFITTGKVADFDTYDIGDGYTFRIGKRDPTTEKFISENI